MTNPVNIVIDSCTDTCVTNNESIKSSGNYYHNILSCLGYPESSPPVADLLRRLHGLDGSWLVISPMHWQATHNDAMILAAGDDLQLTNSEGRAWFNAFSESVLAENMQLYYHDATTWLIKAPDYPAIHVKPVHTLLHISIMSELSTLDSTFYWQRFITESQMFLSSHSLNKDRKNRYPINGLWIWGHGVLQEPSNRQIIINEPNTKPLADLLSTNVHLYSENARVPKNSLILWSNVQQSLVKLQTRLRKQTIYLYWNNQAYKIKSQNWMKRLGVIFNAD